LYFTADCLQVPHLIIPVPQVGHANVTADLSLSIAFLQDEQDFVVIGKALNMLF
jgi:hypothetical protein